MREAGQGRNPAALSEVGCVLFLCTVYKPFEIKLSEGFLCLIFRNRVVAYLSLGTDF